MLEIPDFERLCCPYVGVPAGGRGLGGCAIGGIFPSLSFSAVAWYELVGLGEGGFGSMGLYGLSVGLLDDWDLREVDDGDGEEADERRLDRDLVDAERGDVAGVGELVLHFERDREGLDNRDLFPILSK